MHEDKLFMCETDCVIASQFAVSLDSLLPAGFKCGSPFLYLISLRQVLWGGQGERHGHLPCVWFPELCPKHATGHGGSWGSRRRSRGRHLVHRWRLGPDEAEVLAGILSETGRRARQSWHPHPVHQGEETETGSRVPRCLLLFSSTLRQLFPFKWQSRCSGTCCLLLFGNICQPATTIT